MYLYLNSNGGLLEGDIGNLRNLSQLKTLELIGPEEDEGARQFYGNIGTLKTLTQLRTLILRKTNISI